MENVNIKISLKIIIIITFIIFILFVGVMFKMIDENGKCVDSPFRYSAIKLEEAGGNYMCSCKSIDPKLLDFYFDIDGIHIIRQQDIINLNYKDYKGGKK